MRTPIRVVFADDEPLARKRMRSLLTRHADVEIVAECANGPEAVEAARAHAPDVLFLDVEMPGVSGVEVARTLGPRAVPVVVFVTAYDQHAVHAFEQHALDYVLKPVDEHRFDRTLDRVRERLSERAASGLSEELLRLLARPPAVQAPVYPERLAIRSTERVTFVEVGAIDWIEAEGDYVRLHTGAVSHLMRSTLSALEAQLDPAAFVRIHRSTIVRTARIRELQPYFHGEYVVILADGTRLKLTRSHRERLQRALGQTI